MAIHNTKVTFKTIKSDIYKSDSAIREAVANAIDAESKNVYLSVYEEQIQGSLDGVFKYFCLDIADDGNGIPMENDEFEEVFCQYKVSTKNEKTNYGRRGKGRYTYLTATRDPSNVIIFTKNKTKWYQVKFEANETDNIQITNVNIDSKPSTNIRKNFTTLVQLKDLDINKFELDEVNIEHLIQEIKAEIISLPPLIEQKEIVKKIENLFKICDKLETQINSSKTNSQTLMQAVLKEAFEG